MKHLNSISLLICSLLLIANISSLQISENRGKTPNPCELSLLRGFANKISKRYRLSSQVINNLKRIPFSLKHIKKSVKRVKKLKAKLRSKRRQVSKLVNLNKAKNNVGNSKKTLNDFKRKVVKDIAGLLLAGGFSKKLTNRLNKLTSRINSKTKKGRKLLRKAFRVVAHIAKLVPKAKSLGGYKKRNRKNRRRGHSDKMQSEAESNTEFESSTEILRNRQLRKCYLAGRIVAKFIINFKFQNRNSRSAKH